MNGVNLIPTARRRARSRRRQLRLWTVATVVCAMLLAGAYGVLWSMWSTRQGDLVADADTLAQEITAAEKQEKLGRMAVREAKAAADAAHEVSDQPDWGVLLSFVADKLGSDAALESIRLEPAKQAEATGLPGTKAPPGKATKPVAPGRAGRYTLVLTGMAKTQDAASRVAIDLKQTELFEGVALVETRRTKFMGGEAVAFQIECGIAGAGGGE